MNETIENDYKEALLASKAKGVELQQERLDLISHKIKEELNQDVTFEAKDGESREKLLPFPETQVRHHRWAVMLSGIARLTGSFKVKRSKVQRQIRRKFHPIRGRPEARWN